MSFVCARPYWPSGSSHLRTVQLAEIAARRVPTVRVRELAELDGDVEGEVLILNKSCLREQSLGRLLERLPDLRRRNVCLADPVDLPVPDEILAHFDCVIAASMAQAEHFAARLSNPVFLIHHHVDTRLPAAGREWDRARIAYFGELANTWHADSLNDLVDFFSVDTANSIDVPWAQHLPFYNVHYCLRRTHPADGFKPATKLFLAAALGAPVVIERANIEAGKLLPGDYPYFTESTERAEVRRVLHRVAETFATDEWRYAVRCMAAIDCYRSEHILDSIEAMLLRLG